MIFGRWLRIVARRSRALTIELGADDRLRLGMKLCNLSAAERGALQWSEEALEHLYKGLMARNPKGYQGWHPERPRMVPVMLERSEWQMIAQLCSELPSNAATDNWPSRVMAQISAKID